MMYDEHKKWARICALAHLFFHALLARGPWNYQRSRSCSRSFLVSACSELCSYEQRSLKLWNFMWNCQCANIFKRQNDKCKLLDMVLLSFTLPTLYVVSILSLRLLNFSKKRPLFTMGIFQLFFLVALQTTRSYVLKFNVTVTVSGELLFTSLNCQLCRTFDILNLRKPITSSAKNFFFSRSLLSHQFLPRKKRLKLGVWNGFFSDPK